MLVDLGKKKFPYTCLALSRLSLVPLPTSNNMRADAKSIFQERSQTEKKRNHERKEKTEIVRTSCLEV